MALLIRLFFSRFFDREALSPQAEAEANVTQILGILAAPGVFFLFLCVPFGMRGWDLVALRCLFICYSMIVIGFIMVLEWDALFLDRRDYQILSPLPLALWKIFVAKIAALGLFLGLFLVDLNLLTTLMWGGIEKRNAMEATWAHLLTVVAAGLFAALAAASIQGLLLALPSKVFRGASVGSQTLLMTLLVMAFFLAPLISISLPGFVRSHNSLVSYFPAYWFTGLNERLRPVVRSAVLSEMGVVATRALGCAAVIFVLTHLPGYKRHARKIGEAAPPTPSGPGRVRVWLGEFVDERLLGRPVQQAVFHFIGQTIGRSMRHRLFMASYAGFGAAVAILSVGSEKAGLLRLPLILSFVLVSGLRAAFNFPAELGANWVFQMADASYLQDCLAATRKWIVICGVGPLFLLMAPIEFAFFPWVVALFHLAFGVMLSAVLVEVMFSGFRKIPFTCAYFPGRVNLVFLGVVYVFGFSVYSGVMAGVEGWLLRAPIMAVGFFLATGCALWVRWRGEGHRGEVVDYLGGDDPVVRTLGLTGY